LHYTFLHEERLIARRLTSRLIRIYERSVESRRRSAVPHSVGQIIVFRAVVPGMHTSDAEDGRATSRKKQPDATVVVVVGGEDENGEVRRR